MRIAFLGAVVFSTHIACTLGAPAMNDADGVTDAIMEQLSISAKQFLPECTTARDGIRAYVRADKLVATCSNEAWHDANGNVVDTTPAASTESPPNTELPADDAGPGTVRQP